MRRTGQKLWQTLRASWRIELPPHLAQDTGLPEAQPRVTLSPILVA